ncbi:MAG: GNAT family N-acetyltransferase [Stellaceae bacterium]
MSTALGGTVAVLEDMAVSPHALGAGIGGLLLDRAISAARDAGCRRITVLTDGDNKAAHRFYERHGFARSAMIPLPLALHQ